MGAQTASNVLTSEPPVLPMDLKFRYVPQYFEQSFTDDPRYARTEALVDGLERRRVSMRVATRDRSRMVGKQDIENLAR